MPKKTEMFLIPECACDSCSGEENGLPTCVRDAVGLAHTVKVRQRGGVLLMKCGLLAPEDAVIKKRAQDTALCVNCLSNNVIWHRPHSPQMRHDELVSGIASLHDLIGNLYSFVSAHMHAGSEDGAATCEVCKAARKGFDEHRKGCPDCHE